MHADPELIKSFLYCYTESQASVPHLVKGGGTVYQCLYAHSKQSAGELSFLGHRFPWRRGVRPWT